ESLREFVHDFGVGLVGGCCGTTPEHIQALVAAIGHSAKPRKRAGRSRWFVSSGMTAVALEQEPRPLLIGERLNTQGSRKVKRLALEGTLDDLVPIAREQVEGGAHVLDLCMALTERTDEAEQMRRLVKRLSLSVEAPLCIDSTEAHVIDVALQACPGSAIVNSINLENGRERIDSVMPLVMRHGAAVIALTIDETGMAKTAERKLEVARRIHDICTREYGLPPELLIFDDLTFTLATGDEEFARSGVETLEGIKLIKRELPGVLTSLGVSNVSFGLGKEARAVLNSVFLYHGVQAGLDMAIVNPADIIPYAELSADDRKLAEDLVFAREPQALAAYIAHFEGRTP
ncbi:MAG: dihydropteroate synthase, partial [Candidatus Eisenbacteria bacterium]|nr:dihydropteroate synthase [Candidatus Eisenbacteria bacterium]